MKRRIVHGCFGFAGLMALILDGQTALQGAAQGIELCLRTVIPSLFPFIFLCAMLTQSQWGTSLTLLQVPCRRLGIPRGAESLLLSAVLGGYPAGAQAIGAAYGDGRLIKEDAEHLLTFCSNAGPAFLFGITALQFSSLTQIWALWTIQIAAATLTAILGTARERGHAQLKSEPPTISQLLTQTTKTMAILCGWILLFQILLGFLNRWFFWYFPEPWQVILTGLLELSSGCCALGRIGNESIRFLVCTVMLSFGGICVVMQTASVIQGLSIHAYLRGKMVQAILGLGLAAMYLRFGWFAFLPLLVIFPVFTKKRSGFLHPSGV